MDSGTVGSHQLVARLDSRVAADYRVGIQVAELLDIQAVGHQDNQVVADCRGFQAVEVLQETVEVGKVNLVVAEGNQIADKAQQEHFEGSGTRFVR